MGWLARAQNNRLSEVTYLKSAYIYRQANQRQKTAEVSNNWQNFILMKNSSHKYQQSA